MLPSSLFPLYFCFLVILFPPRTSTLLPPRVRPSVGRRRAPVRPVYICGIKGTSPKRGAGRGGGTWGHRDGDGGTREQERVTKGHGYGHRDTQTWGHTERGNTKRGERGHRDTGTDRHGSTKTWGHTDVGCAETREHGDTQTRGHTDAGTQMGMGGTRTRGQKEGVTEGHGGTRTYKHTDRQTRGRGTTGTHGHVDAATRGHMNTRTDRHGSTRLSVSVCPSPHAGLRAPRQPPVTSCCGDVTPLSPRPAPPPSPPASPGGDPQLPPPQRSPGPSVTARRCPPAATRTRPIQLQRRQLPRGAAPPSSLRS